VSVILKRKNRFIERSRATLPFGGMAMAAYVVIGFL